jgi:hypothetical protein
VSTERTGTTLDPFDVILKEGDEAVKATKEYIGVTLVLRTKDGKTWIPNPDGSYSELDDKAVKELEEPPKPDEGAEGNFVQGQPGLTNEDIANMEEKETTSRKTTAASRKK